MSLLCRLGNSYSSVSTLTGAILLFSILLLSWSIAFQIWLLGFLVLKSPGGSSLYLSFLVPVMFSFVSICFTCAPSCPWTDFHSGCFTVFALHLAPWPHSRLLGRRVSCWVFLCFVVSLHFLTPPGCWLLHPPVWVMQGNMETQSSIPRQNGTRESKGNKVVGHEEALPPTGSP